MLIRSLLILTVALLVSPVPSFGQVLRGTVLDSSTDGAVPYAAVHLLDAGRSVITSVLADSIGRFILVAPEIGEYMLSAERFGYLSTHSPLLALADSGTYELDLELDPDPFQLDAIDVVVRNEAMMRWLTLRGHVGNPNALFGFRSIQGERLAAARLRARDNTDFLRWLYFPVSHRAGVCVSIRTGCARIFVDDRWVPSAHLESIDLASVVAVVALPLEGRPELHFFTAAFEWRRE